jgi:hypothetical protein
LRAFGFAARSLKPAAVEHRSGGRRETPMIDKNKTTQLAVKYGAKDVPAVASILRHCENEEEVPTIIAQLATHQAQMFHPLRRRKHDTRA